MYPSRREEHCPPGGVLFRTVLKVFNDVFGFQTQRHALFYSDNFTRQMTYMSRNRQLSTFWDAGPGLKASYSAGRIASRFDIKVTTAYQWMRFQYRDFSDIRTGKPYSFDANVAEIFVSATY